MQRLCGDNGTTFPNFLRFTKKGKGKLSLGGKTLRSRTGAWNHYLLCIVWRLLFSADRLLNYTLPGSFSCNPALAQQGQVLADGCMWFSAVTLTAAGLGDVTPSSSGQTLLMLEGLDNQKAISCPTALAVQLFSRDDQ